METTMEYVIAAVVLAGVGYFIYRRVTRPRPLGESGTGVGGGRPGNGGNTQHR